MSNNNTHKKKHKQGSNRKLFLRLIRPMLTAGGEVQLHEFLTATADAQKWSASLTSRFISPHPLQKKLWIVIKYGAEWAPHGV